MFTSDDLSLVFKRDIRFGADKVIIDTRNCDCSNSIFFGMRGNNFDGSKFAIDAIKAGASLCVVSDTSFIIPEHKEKFIVVDNTLQSLWDLARYARERLNVVVIGITGSIGKTTTKHFLSKILQHFGSTYASYASYNNEYGVALTIANTPIDTQYLVLEMGMNHPNEIRKLASLAKPDIAVITKIAAAHIEVFNSVHEIAMAKAEIFEHTTSYAVLDMDDEYYSVLSDIANKHDLKVCTFSSNSNEHCRIENREAKNYCYFRDNKYEFIIHCPSHCVKVVGIISIILDLLKLDIATGLRYLEEIDMPKGRGNIYKIHDNIMIIDSSYNANPTSMAEAIEDLGKRKTGNSNRTIACLGDMLELGKYSAEMHQRIAELLIKAGIDLVLTIGAESIIIQHAIKNQIAGQHFDNIKDLSNYLIKSLQPSDIIMFKGSNAMGLDGVIQCLYSL